ncbi:sulfur carrier protein ThiS [Sinorhizobium psoraleae]|uniref:Sulfur carrier protein ThiS n=1 Tax=Sinorhizobium psoraleae TaxID=520838 RepID=A0ABT4KR64_9HYPH|nr:sulfur carrier protein ThiS [Sinorhizobium psoraleae]MCZ4094424.1 sulfur carrier protein ThiS [Sinorhizobium psoraleae]
MTYIVNGETLESSAETLSELLLALEYEGDWLATAVNGELVHRTDRASHRLNDRDRIEILSPMKGG